MIPQHVAIIMDGNRRWAKKHHLPILAGHRQVAEKVLKPLIIHARELGIKYLTLWAFSTENWQRDKKEIMGLISIIREFLKKKIDEANKEGIRLNVLGDISAFPRDIQEGLKKGMAITAENTAMTVNFALNYGGRDEIIRAIKKVQSSEFKVQGLSERDFNQFLNTAGMPDPDLIIRTGGEMRLSGFMSWQSAYSELYFTQTLMPDFTPEELDKAVADFGERQRWFGR